MLGFIKVVFDDSSIVQSAHTITLAREPCILVGKFQIQRFSAHVGATYSLQQLDSDYVNCNASLASPAPSVMARNFAQAICGCKRPPKPQSVPAMTFSLPTSAA